MGTKQFVMLVGLPGSGKSTYASQPFFKDFVYISTDDIIEKFATQHGKTYDQCWASNIDQATKLANSKFDEAIKRGMNIIWDQTNLTPKKRRSVLNRVPKDYETTAVYFEVDEAIRQDRLANRPGKTIPKHIDASMRDSYIRPDIGEGFTSVVNRTFPVDFLVIA